LLVVREDPAGKSVPLLALRVGPDEREALLSIGHHPFFASRTGHDRFVVVLTDDTDWEELRELVTESYRILVPKKLTALLDQHALAAGPAAAMGMRTAQDPEQPT